MDYGASPQLAETTYQKVDVNNDKEVDFSEFVNFLIAGEDNRYYADVVTADKFAKVCSQPYICTNNHKELRPETLQDA